MPKKKKTTKKATKKKVVPGSKKLTNANWEIFARLYGGENSEYFGNAKRSYMLAYGYVEKAAELKDAKREADYGSDEYNEAARALSRIEANAESSSSDLLRKPKVAQRINWYLDQGLDDVAMDRELAFVARQRKDLSSKVRAISEFNKVRERTKGGVVGELIVKWED
jgi:hypothetical protein